MAEPKIEKNVPIPRGLGRPGKQKWLKILLQMDIGDSFTVDTAAERDRFKHSACDTRRQARKAVTTDKVYVVSQPEGDKFRIWRVAPPSAGDNNGHKA